MKIFRWQDISSIKDSVFFDRGTGLSTGSFDGVHLGHRSLINTLVEGCKKRDFAPGIISFTRPLPSMKKAGTYPGDISTLSQRLSIFEELGIEFVILVDFDEAFARNSGYDYLKILKDNCNMKYLVEGFDFRCGYKGATDVSAIKSYSNDLGFDSDFVDAVIFSDENGVNQRISSSFVRNLIMENRFEVVKELLKRNFVLDLTGIEKKYTGGQVCYNRDEIIQVLPAIGEYICRIEEQKIHVSITEDKVYVDGDMTNIVF